MRPFPICLNTSTIRGQSLSLPGEIKITAEVGYDGIEPWMREIDAYLSSGGDLAELRELILESGLSVPNMIGFFSWAADDDKVRAEGFEEARRNMEICAILGCSRIAAPPFGVTDVSIPLSALVDRYGALLDLGKRMGVVPVLEFWGMSQTLQRLSESIAVAVQVGDADACILADVFHMAKGGSPFEGLGLIGPRALALLHLNDYPAGPLESMTDGDRVYPGDGTAPLDDILISLYQVGFRGVLSIELFNQVYWQQDAAHVAKNALKKTRRVIESAIQFLAIEGE